MSIGSILRRIIKQIICFWLNSIFDIFCTLFQIVLSVSNLPWPLTSLNLRMTDAFVGITVTGFSIEDRVF